MKKEQVFYYAVVENNIDPLKLYRCQVRVWGIHTENKSDSGQKSYISVEDLPWADVLTHGSGIDEQGEFIPISKGSVVIVSFADPEQQRPIIMGTLPRFVAEMPNFENGFSDPDQIHPSSTKLDESTISRLARNEKISETIIQDKIDNRKTGIDCNGSNWDEPITKYATEYPQNRIIHTKHHVFEMDDTEAAPRIHIYHKSGSSKEFHPNGDIVDITISKQFTIVISDDNILIEGDQNIRIAGSQNIQIVGSENEKIEQNNNKDILGSQNINIDGSQIVNIGGNQNIVIDGSQNISAASAMTLTSPVITLEGLVNVTNGINIQNGVGAIFSGNIDMTGTMSLNGSINTTGNISSGGSIMDASGNTNHHSHP